MPKKLSNFFLLLLIISTSIQNCSSTTRIKINGTIDYLGDAPFYIEKEPLHYKYSVKNQTPINVTNDYFETEIEIIESQIIWLVLQDSRYPIYVEPDHSLTINIKRASFPFDVEVTGGTLNVNKAYQSFLKDTEGLDATILVEMDKFSKGQKNKALAYSAKKIEFAEKHFKGTKLAPLFLKIIGEDLVLKLRAIEYSARFIPTFNADEERTKVIKEANNLNFFSLESLKSQRAGIRDFSHYYSRTFGIYDSVIAAYGTTLSEYDIKQVAYKPLNEKRLQVLTHIKDRTARAYADLFLVAERIGEQPITISEPTYLKYKAEYAEFSEYIDFITYFYNEIKSVSPGQPAIPFNISDRDGNIHTLEDYKGSFILLDFWAGWCIPCLDEFEDMNKIYNKYSRDELEILGISTEVDSLVWIQDITRFKNPWKQLYGGKGMEQETFKAYKGGGIPFYILIDPEGNIARYNDIRPSFNFNEVLDSLLVTYKN